jgi:hypothetical protein
VKTAAETPITERAFYAKVIPALFLLFLLLLLLLLLLLRDHHSNWHSVLTEAEWLHRNWY